MADSRTPLLSVLMPSYNAGPFLREAIESTLADIRTELIVQDSLSNDETPRILEEYSDNPRVRVIREKDNGQADALNRALAHASADWIGWMNADDLYRDGALQEVLDLIQSGQADEYSILYGDFDLIDSANRRLRAYRVRPWEWRRILRRGCYVFYGSTFIKQVDLQRVGGFDSTLHYCMDLDLFLKLGPAARARKIERTIGALRIHDASKTSTKGLEFLTEAFHVRRRHRQGLLGLITSTTSYLHAFVHTIAAPIRYSQSYSRLRRAKQI